MSDKFKQYIDDAERILITSHVSPDPDAVASVLLLGTTLELNFPNKKIEMILEEEPEGLNFLNGYEQIKFEPLAAATESLKPDFLIIVDANNYERCSRKDGLKIRDYVTRNHTKTAILDHHEPEGQDRVDIYLNSGNPACAQEVYELCFGGLKLNKPGGYAQTTMLGLYADTGGFAYKNPSHSATLALADELIGAGANIEQIKNALYQYTEDDMRILGELANNVSGSADYSYSYINDGFVEQWLKDDKTATELNHGTKAFVNDFIRNIDGRKWGFIVYKNVLHGDDMYSVSLRAVGDARDVAKIATQLAGGGHKPAAGGKIQARSVEEAIDKVKAVIAQTP
jgi:phosphoesterase RecJ-like protein